MSRAVLIFMGTDMAMETVTGTGMKTAMVTAMEMETDPATAKGTDLVTDLLKDHILERGVHMNLSIKYFTVIQIKNMDLSAGRGDCSGSGCTFGSGYGWEDSEGFGGGFGSGFGGVNGEGRSESSHGNGSIDHQYGGWGQGSGSGFDDEENV